MSAIEQKDFEKYEAIILSDKMTSDQVDFDAIYGEGAMDRARQLINALGPVTRRDEWWATDGPYEIIAQHFAAAVNRP